MSIRTYPVSIIADYREVPSKVPEILKKLGAKVEFSQLKTGDYIINNEIIVERKSRDDFILSIIQGRLFLQCSRLKNTSYSQVLLIEGNPYNTRYRPSGYQRGAAIGVAFVANTYNLFGKCR